MAVRRHRGTTRLSTGAFRSATGLAGHRGLPARQSARAQQPRGTSLSPSRVTPRSFRRLPMDGELTQIDSARVAFRAEQVVGGAPIVRYVTDWGSGYRLASPFSGAMGAQCCCVRQRRGEPQVCDISWLSAARQVCRYQGLARLRRRRMKIIIMKARVAPPASTAPGARAP